MCSGEQTLPCIFHYSVNVTGYPNTHTHSHTHSSFLSWNRSKLGMNFLLCSSLGMSTMSHTVIHNMSLTGPLFMSIETRTSWTQVKNKILPWILYFLLYLCLSPIYHQRFLKEEYTTLSFSWFCLHSHSSSQASTPKLIPTNLKPQLFLDYCSSEFGLLAP